jgi:NTP pyrophosphatase (non-canonical NTP hydrolase)
MKSNPKSTQHLIDSVRHWGVQKGITGKHGKATCNTQYSKLLEEVAEIGTALDDGSEFDAIDGIGDSAVVLILLAELIGVPFEECLDQAYNVIKSRKGKMINGTFVKES